MTAKEQLQNAVGRLSEAEAADVLELITRTRGFEGQDAVRILDGIDGAFERARLGRAQAEAGETTSLDDLARGSR